MVVVGSCLLVAKGAGAASQEGSLPKAPAPRAPTTQPAPAPPKATGPATPDPAAAAAGIKPPSDYVIGAEDVLQVVFWRDEKMSSDVTVRPDGMITLPLLNDVKAAGLTPDQLRNVVTKAATKYLTEPNVTIVIKTINSRKVFVTGSVVRPGPYPLIDQMTVLQMLAVAGGLGEYADRKEIRVMRTENGQTKSFKFNYRDVSKGKNLEQNILLKPGDTIIVP